MSIHRILLFFHLPFLYIPVIAARPPWCYPLWHQKHAIARLIQVAGLTMDKLQALCKNRGFIFAGSEIYGGLSNTWDYGPLGVEYKNNIKKAFLPTLDENGEATA